MSTSRPETVGTKAGALFQRLLRREQLARYTLLVLHGDGFREFRHGVVSPGEEEIARASMGDVGVELVLESIPDAHAGPRKRDVDGCRELRPNSASRTFGASSADVRALTEDHICSALCEIVRARTADDSATYDNYSHTVEKGPLANGSIVGK